MSGLAYHEKTHWKEGNKCYICEDCGNGYSSKRALDIHMDKHSNSKQYVCDFCARSYNDPNSLRRHVKYHTGEYVSCLEPSCDRKFVSRSVMLAHMHVHTGIKPFDCHLCGKTFTAKAKMQEHMLLHQGVRPFTCPVCERAFTQKSNMLVHASKIHQIHPSLIHVEKLEDRNYISRIVESLGKKTEMRGQYIGSRSRTNSNKKLKKSTVESELLEETASQDKRDDYVQQEQDTLPEQCNKPPEETNHNIPIDKHSNEQVKIADFEIAREIPIGSNGDVIQVVQICHEQQFQLIESVMSGEKCVEGDMYEEEDKERDHSIDEEQHVIYMDSEVAQNVEVVDCL